MNVIDDRKVLHYKGNLVLNFDRSPKGPDMDGGFWRAVLAIYNDENDLTAISFVPIPPAEWTAEMALKRSKQMSNRERIHYLMANLNPRRRFYTNGQQPTTNNVGSDSSGAGQEGGGRNRRAARRSNKRSRR